MPVRELPDSVVSTVLDLLIKYHHQPGKSSGEALWVKKMLATACRHIEYFVEPLVSAAALQIADSNNLGDLKTQRWRARKGWTGGQELYFEHAKPASDLLKELVALGRSPSFDMVKEILLTAEVAWITVFEEERLSKNNRANWKEEYKANGIELL